jgi:hypothetical protein
MMHDAATAEQLFVFAYFVVVIARAFLIHRILVRGNNNNKSSLARDGNFWHVKESCWLGLLHGSHCTVFSI